MTDNNCTLFKDQQHYCTAIYAVKQIVSSLELVGSLFIIFVIWLFKTYKYFNQRLILALSVAALGESISILMTGVPQDRGPLCQTQAWLLTYFVLGVLFWVCCITFNIWRATRGDRAKRLERYYHMISWGVPLIFASLPFSQDVYGPAGPWCWIAGDVENSAIWRMATYYIPLFICIIGLFTVCMFILITHRRQAQRWQGVYSRNNATEHQQRQLWMKDVKSLMAYPVIYFLLSLAPFIHRVYNIVSSKPNFTLILLHVISIPLTGLINAFAFGWNKETLRRLNRDNFKVALQQHFAFGNARIESSMGEHRLGEPTEGVQLDTNALPLKYHNPGMDNDI